MDEQDRRTPEDPALQEKRLRKWAHLLGVVFRIFLVAGMLLFIAAVILLLLTDLFSAWILLLPVALIALGIILARVEYHLDMRLFNFYNLNPVAGENQHHKPD